MSVFLVNDRKDRVTEYESRAEAEEQRDTLIELGMDSANVEIKATDPRKDDVETAECGICGEPVPISEAKSGKGGTPIHPGCYNTPPEEQHQTEDGATVEQGGKVENKEPTEPEVVEEHTDVDQSLPDRELHNDPISWLQQGSNEFTANIKGTTVITKKGFRVLQHKYDISTGSDVIVGPEENGHEFCRVKAWAEMPDGRRAEAHASASVDRGDDSYLLVSMADTRAKSRALSDVTGVGAVAVEEMAGVQSND